MNQRKLLYTLLGLGIFFAIIIFGLTIDKQRFKGNPQSIIENLAPATQLEILTQNSPSLSIEMTVTSSLSVWIYCSECNGGAHVLWESPNEMGIDSLLVNEGEECVILNQQTSISGISKVELLCGNRQGWLSSEGISYTAP